jgi:hypothetical protein
MDITERIKEIVDSLEDAIAYDDMGAVEDARKELIFILEDLESDYPSNFDEDF